MTVRPSEPDPFSPTDHGDPRTDERMPYAPEDQCKLIGAGDGSVMVYCTPCRVCLHPNAVTLNAVSGLWEEHTEAHHEAYRPTRFVPTPDPWTDPDAAALAEPPPF